MKETQFRWIDKYLIRLSLQDKFYLILLLPLVTLAVLMFILNSASNSLIVDLRQEELFLIKSLIEAGNISQSQVVNVIANSDKLSIGSGLDTIPVMNGEYRIGFRGDDSILTALSYDQIALILLTLLIFAFGVYNIMTFIGGAMFAMNKALNTLANGDLTARLNYIPARDEFSEIANTIDKVAEREEKMVQSIRESIVLMKQIGEDLNLSITNSSEISITQQEHLNSLGSATEQMACTIREVAMLANDSSMQTNEAKSVAHSGQVKVEYTLSSISNLTTEIESASQAVEELDVNAAQIDAVVTTISGISEQTNLLALNAAIEAARAGEQGRGFAVVADEVRALAGRTQRATVEIQTMIEALQRNSQSLTKLMETTVYSANEGQRLMTEVNDEIGSLADKNQTISDSSIQIVTAAEEQGLVADNIALSVEEIRIQANNVCNLIATTSQNIERLALHSDKMESMLKGIKCSDSELS
ncbi:methyl-accepting chemotaxis protein [Vibrio owensii]|uniref:methyl-accepting chemotaxis protein n=1 Tax=Vibrio owensii TaxID=696485 RepID=UPI003AACF43D